MTIIEGSSVLYEMATLRKKDSKLPVNLYIDDSFSYQRGSHSKRIKFQTDKDDRPNTRSNFSSITLDGGIVESTLPRSMELSSKDIQKISNFVKNNSNCLLLVSDMEMDFSDFKSYFMIEGSDLISNEQKEKLQNEVNEYLSQ